MGRGGIKKPLNMFVLRFLQVPDTAMLVLGDLIARMTPFLWNFNSRNTNAMSVEIPTELQPQIAAAIARGNYANEQELVSDILRVTVPVLDQYQQLRKDVEDSFSELRNGKLKEADFIAMRQKIVDEHDELGNRR